ncbi:MAG: FAD-binding oxidoreductase [Pseudomonadota bacterium]
MPASISNQEHTGSYYAASVNDATRYPKLMDNESADVCVIGGGFTGLATGLTLSERGYSVAILEANRIGWGASGRNGGQLINGGCGMSKIQDRLDDDSLDDLFWEMRWRGNDLIRERVKKYNIDCDLKDGYVEVAPKASHVPYFEESFEERAKRHFPYEYEIWDKATTQQNLGTDAFHGAFACYRDGHVHPLNLCIGEARAASELGAKIFEQSCVTRIEHGQRPVVHTENGSISCDAVVIAGNAYSRLEPKQLANLVFPAGSYIIATEPLSDELAKEINARDVAVCDTNEVVDYYRLSADKRLLYGGACNYSGRDPSSIKEYILPRMRKVYPQLKDTRIDYEWGGKIGIVLNRTITVGRIHNNVYYCQGYSGHGVCPTHLMGEVMADAIQGTMERYDLFADTHHFRIPGSQWFGNQMIALGMLYYRVKDML